VHYKKGVPFLVSSTCVLFLSGERMVFSLVAQMTKFISLGISTSELLLLIILFILIEL